MRAVLALALMVSACAGAVETSSSTTDAVDRGARLYVTNCSACHGVEAVGTATGPSLLDPVYADLTDADYVIAVEMGVAEELFGLGDMPPVQGLTHSEISAIAGYVRSLREG